MSLRNSQIQLWDFVHVDTTMVTLGNLSPGLEYSTSLVTILATGDRSASLVIHINTSSAITGHQGNNASSRKMVKHIDLTTPFDLTNMTLSWYCKYQLLNTLFEIYLLIARGKWEKNRIGLNSLRPSTIEITQLFESSS